MRILSISDEWCMYNVYVQGIEIVCIYENNIDFLLNFYREFMLKPQVKQHLVLFFYHVLTIDKFLGQMIIFSLRRGLWVTSSIYYENLLAGIWLQTETKISLEAPQHEPCEVIPWRMLIKINHFDQLYSWVNYYFF